MIHDSLPEGALSELLDAAPDGILLVGVDGRILYANEATVSLFGYPRQKLVGIAVERLIPGRHRGRHVSDRIRYTAEPQRRPMGLGLQLQGLRSDGSEVPVEISLAPMTVEQRKLIVVIVRDATEQRKLEEERLRYAQAHAVEEIADRLAQAQKLEAVGRLAGGMAHDFNNLLTIVSGYTRRLLSRPDLADARDDLDQILTASDRAAQLTRELLSFARRGHSDAMLLDLSAIVSELEPMLRRLIAHDIVFDFRVERGVPQVMMDRTVLEQILMNLLLNASDAMPSGGTLTVRTERRSVDEAQAQRRGLAAGEYALLSIADSGIGIPAEVLQRIFEPFFTTKGDKGGTGMGLATVYGDIDQAGGWIDVDSAVDEGTTFHVMLPASARLAQPPSAAEAEERITLLLVEDEPALRKLVVTMLEEKGYAVLQAGNGLDAIAVAERHRGEIDLLVTDVVMPRLSGPELARQLRSVRPGVEVLFMSGYNDSRLVNRGVEQANINLLVKPFTPSQLFSRVRQLTEHSRR